MSYELTIALNVTDDAVYQAYRRAIQTILDRCGGTFRYDFLVASTVTSEAEHPINRVFVLAFKDRAGKESFFADPEYKRIRAEHFPQSLDGFTIIAEYGRER